MQAAVDVSRLLQSVSDGRFALADPDPWLMVLTYVGVALVAAIAAGAQATTGFGFSLIAVPIVAVLVGPKASVVGMAIVGPLVTSAIAFRERANIRWRTVAIVSCAALAGLPIGLLVLSQANDRGLTVGIGVAVVVMAFALWHGIRLPVGGGTEVAAGILSGALATSTGTNGPPLVIALQASPMKPGAFRGTLSVCFLAQGMLAILGFWRTGHLTLAAIYVAAAAMPGVIVGWLAGERAFARLDADRFRSIVLVMLVASGAVVALDAIVR